VTFESVLFRDDEQVQSNLDAPDHFGDFNLDQVVDAVTASWQSYNLAPFLHAPLHSVDAVRYRQNACRDLDNRQIRKAVDGVAEAYPWCGNVGSTPCSFAIEPTATSFGVDMYRRMFGSRTAARSGDGCS
jgi:hypothetical protein